MDYSPTLASGAVLPGLTSSATMTAPTFRPFLIWTIRVLQLALLFLGSTACGVWLSGKPIDSFWRFPPLPIPRESAPFSWTVFIGMTLLIATVVGPVIYRICRNNRPAPKFVPHAFPWWGWLGLLTMLSFWMLSWTRFDWFGHWQQQTFTPLWLGYILSVNGLCQRRNGSCLINKNPHLFLALFPTSALLWTGFEQINLIVRNWHYPGVSQLSVIQYLLRSSLPFATVLPAVLSTLYYLRSFPRLSAGLNPWQPINLPVAWPTAALCTGLVGMVALGAWPQFLFPLLWLAPLLIVWGLQARAGQHTPLHYLASGDWRPLWLPAVSVLVCGFFWELWNTYSLAKWEYTIPGVGRFYLFEMPLLGYAGYLPFGLFCAATTEFLLPRLSKEIAYPRKSA